MRDLNMRTTFIFIAMVCLLFGNAKASVQKGSYRKATKYQNSAWSRMQQYGHDDEEAKSLYIQAIEEYKRCIASGNKKIGDIYHNLGRIYSTSPQSLRDYDEAIRCFSETLKIYDAKKQTSSITSIKSSCYNDIGNTFCMKKDFSSAFSSYQKAADLSPLYYSNLAKMYWLGLSVERDLPKAMSLFRKASVAGMNEWDKIYAIDYQLNEYQKDSYYSPAVDLYMNYVYMRLINESKSIWLSVLIQAADMDYPPAQTDLWKVYEETKETDKGLPYLQKAANCNYLPGITAMGESYMEFGFSHYKIRNFAEGERWLKKAALEGEPMGQFKLGLLYYYKNGVFLPSVEYLNMAEYWFNEADKQGVSSAAYFRNQASKGSAAKQQLQLEIKNSIANIINAANYQKRTSFIENSSPSSNASSSEDKANTQKTQTANDLRNKQVEERAYNGYSKILMNMNYGYSLYNDSDRITAQSKMKQIRQKWEDRGYSFYKSEWEDWNGIKK